MLEVSCLNTSPKSVQQASAFVFWLQIFQQQKKQQITFTHAKALDGSPSTSQVYMMLMIIVPCENKWLSYNINKRKLTALNSEVSPTTLLDYLRIQFMVDTVRGNYQGLSTRQTTPKGAIENKAKQGERSRGISNTDQDDETNSRRLCADVSVKLGPLTTFTKTL